MVCEGSGKGRKFSKVLLDFIFCTIWKKINPRTFQNEEHHTQFLKNFFLRNLLSRFKNYIKLYYLSSLDFLEWMGSA